jgi:hypothetical protein
MVLATAQPNVNPASCANAPTPMNVPNKTSAKIDDSADFAPSPHAPNLDRHRGESWGGRAKSDYRMNRITNDARKRLGVKSLRMPIAGCCRAQSTAGRKLDYQRQIEGSRADDDIDATTHNAANARPIIPKINTTASWPARRHNPGARTR